MNTIKADKYPVAVKHSCNSVWCLKCYKKNSAPRQSGRMAVMDWQRTRMITLTLNQDAFEGDGEQAYIWSRIAKPIGRFMQNLKRNGIIVTDWTSNLEWHNSGFPHWHLLIEVAQSGKDGMIGQDLLHHLWAWDGLTHRVHETFFKSEDHFKNFCGYFSKTGYLHKDKSHQVILPGWASTRGYEGIRINRFSSKRRPNSGFEPPEATLEPVKRIVQRYTYAYKHGRCGQLTELWQIECVYYDDDPEPVITRTRLRRYNVPFDLVIQHLDGKFFQGAGYSLDLSSESAMRVLKSWEVSPPDPVSDTKRKPFQEALPLDMIHVARKRDLEKAEAIISHARLSYANSKLSDDLGQYSFVWAYTPGLQV